MVVMDMATLTMADGMTHGGVMAVIADGALDGTHGQDGTLASDGAGVTVAAGAIHIMEAGMAPDGTAGTIIHTATDTIIIIMTVMPTDQAGLTAAEGILTTIMPEETEQGVLLQHTIAEEGLM